MRLRQALRLRTFRLRISSFVLVGTAGLVLWASGCASTNASPELTNARAAYQRAAMGKASDDAPAELLTSKQLLDRAEKAHKDGPGSGKEKHFAYLAERQSQLATAQADIVAAQRERSEAERDYVAYQDQLRAQQEYELEKAKTDLADLRNQMAAQQTSTEVVALRQRQRELEDKRAELEARLTGRLEQYEAERTQRSEADKKTQQALNTLKELGNVKVAEHGETVITLPNTALFRGPGGQLAPEARDSLAKVADALKQQGMDKFVIVEGHTDTRGAAKKNEQLSQIRAESVRDYLVEQGVDPNRVKAVGRGDREPVASNNTPQGRANNRRVQIIIKEQTQQPGGTEAGG